MFSSFTLPNQTQAVEDIPIGFDESSPEFYQVIQEKLELPIGFEFNRLRERATILDTQALIASVMEWGQELWIQKTRSSWSSFWMRLKRYFRNLDANFSIMRQLAKEDNYQFLIISRRWGLNPESYTGNMNSVVTGWQVLEFECITLSKLLMMSGIPRTLLDEIDNLIEEIDLISNEVDLITGDSEVVFAKNRITSENHWVYYLVGLQHGLIPDRLLSPSNSIDRMDQARLLREPVSKLDVIEFVYQSMSYIEQFTDDITGFSDEKLFFNRSLIEYATKVCSLGREALTRNR